jgi:uncharacterized protein
MKKEWETAIRRGDLGEVRSLIDNGADIDALDRYHQTGVMVASMRGHTEIVRMLVGRGAKLDVTAKYGLSAMMLAVIRNEVEIVRILAEAGANQEIRGTGAPGFWNKTALELAENAGRKEIASILRNAVAPGRETSR